MNKKVKTVIGILGIILIISGCGKKEKKPEEKIIGTWETKYELSVFGEVTEGYSFKEKGQCVRMLNAGTDIVEKCTYEITEEGIRIIWEDKMDKETYSKYIEIDEDTIMIGEHKYTRKK